MSTTIVHVKWYYYLYMYIPPPKHQTSALSSMMIRWFASCKKPVQSHHLQMPQWVFRNIQVTATKSDFGLSWSLEDTITNSSQQLQQPLLLSVTPWQCTTITVYFSTYSELQCNVFNSFHCPFFCNHHRISSFLHAWRAVKAVTLDKKILSLLLTEPCHVCVKKIWLILLRYLLYSTSLCGYLRYHLRG